MDLITVEDAALQGSRRRADACTLISIYVVILTVIPARLVLSALPLDIAPGLLLGLGLGLLWLCAHCVYSLGMAKGRSWVRTAMYLFAAAQIATYGYATVQYLPADELKSADRSFITIISFVAVALLVCDGIRTISRIEALLRVVVAACVVVATVGLLQFFAGIDLTVYLALPGLRPVGTTDFVLERSVLRRPAGTTGHPIEFGVLCATAVPLAAHIAFQARSRASAWRWWFCLTIIAVGAFVSLSRSAILGLAVAALVLLPTWPSARRWTAAVIGIFFVGALRILVPGLVGTLLSLFEDISNDPSIQGRTDDYASTSNQIASHPLLGRGFGTYLPVKYGPIDNQYLGTLVENGYVGLLVFILLFLAGIASAIAARRLATDPAIRDLAQTLLACVLVITVASVTFDLFAFQMVTGIMFVLLGVVGALLRAVRQEAGLRRLPGRAPAVGGAN